MAHSALGQGFWPAGVVIAVLLSTSVTGVNIVASGARATIATSGDPISDKAAALPRRLMAMLGAFVLALGLFGALPGVPNRTAAGAQEQLAPAPVPAPAPPAESSSLPAGPGQVMEQHLDLPHGLVRSYLLSVTHTYDPARPVPLLIAMGGWGDTAGFFRSYAGLGRTAAADEAIVVYPQGVANAWEGAPYARTAPGEDVDFIRRIVAEVQAHYSIDPARIYALGMSNGGGMAATLACHAPDLVTAVAVVSGAYYAPVNQDCAPQPVGFLDIHGDADPVVPAAGGMRHGASLLPIDAVVASYAARSGCAGTREQAPGHEVFDGCSRMVERARVAGGGHQWYTSPDVADWAWTFLRGQSRPAGDQ